MAKTQPKWPKIPAAFVQQNLTGHKILGLALGAIMYLICLSGTVTVFYSDIERWETAALPEMTRASPQAIEAAVLDARAELAR